MAEAVYDRINDYSAVKISLASPADIRSWSYGEIKKPETINYRTYRAEKDGLFCERIFGPERDWECFCGKYKGMKHKGIICDRCGVKVTHSRVRRKRMGHITLASPIVHIWFFKAMPSRLGNLMAMKTTTLARIIYYQDYVVIDPGDTPLREKQLLTEEEYRACRDKYGDDFKAGMGADAIRALLQNLDLAELSEQLRRELDETGSKQKTKDLTKRLKIVEALRDSDNKAEWMVFDVIPVIPPDLRPLVLLESGNFATSDLNDLYRRVINRNNRLKKLIELNAPEVIIHNEKRMLQQAVDSLFDNGRCKRPVLGSSNRPLKSLTDMIKGKQGRFRENLLGKRVDYSARSVIVVGPELKLNQCGLPKKIALELFQPFIIRQLKEMGHADTIKSAKKMLERKDEEVWDVLEQVIHRHPVLLNRAPTLHRMGIQAFEPVLIEGNAIKIHPLVCKGFNADFDGDQMAVHLPLSVEAQTEARLLMMSTSNIFTPQNGSPVIGPSQDIVLGCYWLTTTAPGEKGEGMVFASREEMITAWQGGHLGLHASIRVRFPEDKEVVGENGPMTAVSGRLFETTTGRVLFNDILGPEMPFYNFGLAQRGLNQVIADCYHIVGLPATIQLLDDIKELGFREATLAGLSFSTEDLRIPVKKEKILAETEKEVARIQKQYERGIITDGERYNQIIDAWTQARELVGQEMMNGLKEDTREGKPYLNPIHLMTISNARGSIDQIRQLAGMRGLMAKPSGKIIETPIRANFREGLRVLEYFSSTHGARKGLADTALKTADSGYLTRKLVDVAQNVVICEHDCGTLGGISKSAVYRGDKVEVPLSDQIVGRVARDSIVNLVTDEVIVRENDIVTEEQARKIEELGYEKVRVRSPMTCESPMGVCQSCYGTDLSTGRVVEEGMAVGIIGAQSIGEPGTQLTMRTFHIGGTAFRHVERPEIRARQGGTLRFHNMNAVTNTENEQVCLSRAGEITLVDDKERELERHQVPMGAVIEVEDGQKLKAGHLVCRWDAHMIPILTDISGTVRFEDIVEGKTMREETDAGTGIKRKVVIEHKGDLHPQIILEDRSGKILGLYPIPEKAHIEVEEGRKVAPGTLLAKTPREITGTQDITGGLPRVTELLEARKPKEPAIISEIDGVVELGEKRRGKRTVIVKNESGQEVEHLVPIGKHLRVHRGDTVRAGDPLVDGPLILQDILRINGEEYLQNYLLREVQNVYRLHNVDINDKHIEIIISQMLQKVRIENPGETDLLPGAIVGKYMFRRTNQLAAADGKKPAVGRPVLLGLTKASLASDSFIAAASFQETTKVLTEAALSGRVDFLSGLKENVILGHLIPAGTAFRAVAGIEIKKHVLPHAVNPLDALTGTEPDQTETSSRETNTAKTPPTANAPGGE